jgi:hypothetical protein
MVTLTCFWEVTVLTLEDEEEEEEEDDEETTVGGAARYILVGIERYMEGGGPAGMARP